MDSVSVLSEVELQNELSIFANAQFTYDIAPGAAADDKKNELNNSQQRFRRESKQLNMHSLLNVKLASLAENNYHTTMTPDAIESYYDQSPDCSPPNGYHSPNPSPPNGYHSPNPTPPNGYHANSPSIFNGIQGIVNPPITYYGDDTTTGYDEDQFMKTMHGRKNSPSLTKEDKRRRNTAASARFRVKKKLREQALQQTADEMTEKAKAFENRVHELEREVKWLKALVVEKKDGPLEQLLMQQHQRHRQLQHEQYAPVGHPASSSSGNYMSHARQHI
ncbi:uncharacterized protein EV154DRAFT_415359 [Mucor mucedo]|uniref:uncharacterized protein n=1 Tax=Mucor mucedo TaxID=29922 RepID=UPI00221FA9A3|nr:uncharacterized protein EV154DRAFT_415359 [Mucor mucedo]KAI7894306.1 hypothetical protein EV154DRAFT_415359 [Mucor mucedo]